MTDIQFGWALNVGPREGMPFHQFNENSRRQIELMQELIDSLWFVDHVQFSDSPVLEGWTALTYLAAQYPQFQVGHMVLCQSFRNPALLAKMTATLQYLSQGRFILGIGAGWHEEEYRAYNFDFPSARARVEQLEETLHIVKALWSEKQVTFQGKHYAVNAAYCEPKPDPLPQIIVGGQGARMLQLVARYADGWNIAWAKPEEYRQKLAIFEQACQQEGRDPKIVQRSWFGRCTCVSSKEEAAKLEGTGLLGTPEQIAEQLQAYIDLGIDYFMLGVRDVSDLTTVELLAHEVLPRFKKRSQVS
ncbi:LLM class flavin-dependent oxidoreductase [Ktedonosporobacter rubrisoli]|uniref:LLM class flavin-dependent oxidoreductase n=1 Tax=Ktedonosporobacter rubrisoli TaxID=2509675 RepID=A0A4P6JN12_KTERU|nr:LLM class flavin-dependent oxidoreductase [Ktedonosporobacter rubrisoli]QBD76644.1 LLM class flavin-dependent oxidoreductase [Ktedonosporobacter rubrisoli]